MRKRIDKGKRKYGRKKRTEGNGRNGGDEIEMRKRKRKSAMEEGGRTETGRRPAEADGQSRKKRQRRKKKTIKKKEKTIKKEPNFVF